MYPEKKKGGRKQITNKTVHYAAQWERFFLPLCPPPRFAGADIESKTHTHTHIHTERSKVFGVGSSIRKAWLTRGWLSGQPMDAAPPARTQLDAVLTTYPADIVIPIQYSTPLCNFAPTCCPARVTFSPVFRWNFNEPSFDGVRRSLDWSRIKSGCRHIAISDLCISAEWNFRPPALSQRCLSPLRWHADRNEWPNRSHTTIRRFLSPARRYDRITG